MSASKHPTYWNSIIIVSAVYGIFATAIYILLGYSQINSANEGTLFPIFGLASLIICLLMAFAGLSVVWYFQKQAKEPMTLGEGAGMGALVGVFLAVVYIILQTGWQIINPAFNEMLLDAMIQNYEVANIPKSQEQMMVDMLASSLRGEITIGGVISGIIGNGLLYAALNALTGMLGVKFFAERKEEEF